MPDRQQAAASSAAKAGEPPDGAETQQRRHPAPGVVAGVLLVALAWGAAFQACSERATAPRPPATAH